MGHYFLYSLQGTDAMVRVFCKEAFDERFHLFGDGWDLGKLRLGVKNGLEDVLLLRSIEGRTTKQQLIQQDSESVEVDLVRMPRSTQTNRYFASIYGAIYSGLPQQEYVTSSSSISGLDSPKSVILILPQRSKRIFYSLMSLKRILFLCKQSSPLSICTMTLLACPSLRLFTFWRQEQRLPLGQYSSPKTMQCLVSKAQSRSIKFQCLMLKSIFFQFYSIFTFFAVVIESFLMNFKALYCISNLHRPRYTCEKPPLPKNLTISKSENSRVSQLMGRFKKVGVMVSSLMLWSASCWKVASDLELISSPKLQLKGTVSNPTIAQTAALDFYMKSRMCLSNSEERRLIFWEGRKCLETCFFSPSRRVILRTSSPKLSSSVDWNCSLTFMPLSTLFILSLSALNDFSLGVEMQLNMTDFSQGVPSAVLLTRQVLLVLVVFFMKSSGFDAFLVRPLLSLRGYRQDLQLERSQRRGWGWGQGEVILRRSLADFDLEMSIMEKGIITIQIYSKERGNRRGRMRGEGGKGRELGMGGRGQDFSVCYLWTIYGHSLLEISLQLLLIFQQSQLPTKPLFPFVPHIIFPLQSVSLFYEIQLSMQVAKKFPPLPPSKPSQKISLYPSVMAMLQAKPFSSKKTISKRELKMESQEEIPLEDVSLKRESESCRSVSVSRVRNRSCQALGERKGKRVLEFSQALLERTEIPEVSAKSWMLYEMKENRCLYGKRNYKKREIASLTKMMNLITILELVERSGLEAKQIRVRASKNSCAMIGTTAEIKYGAVYSLYDLYFGMMLPSGNDAAYLIAQVGSTLLRLMRDQGRIQPQIWEQVCREGILDTRSSNVTLFLKEMNRLSWAIGMTCSNFANPHGLSNTSNYSTALDVCKLCTYSMRNQQFRRIVSTQAHNYRCEYIDKPQTDKQNMDPNILSDLFLDKSVFMGRWQNTNKMLGEGWTGIKTGVTPNAGPCLAASVCKTLNGRQYEFLVVLLNSESMQSRWVQVRSLIEWSIQSRLYL